MLLYRCARFLLHYKHHAEENSLHVRPQTCYAYPLEQGSQKQFTSHVKPRSAVSRPSPALSVYDKNAFEQPLLKSRSASLSDKRPSLPDVTGRQAKKTSISDTGLTKKEIPELTTVRATVSDQQLATAKLPDVSTHLLAHKPPDIQKAPSHTNRTLRYMVHHFPQVSSRGSSAMVKPLICTSSYLFHCFTCRAYAVQLIVLYSAAPW